MEGDLGFNKEKLKIWCYLNHIYYLSWSDKRKKCCDNKSGYFFYSVVKIKKKYLKNYNK